eukprot:g6792.t1
MKSWHYPLRKNHSWMLISIILVVVSKIVNGFQLRKGKPNLMDRPARNFPLPGPDGPDEYNPESFPKWMKPKVDDDTDQGGSIANRESPNRYHKPLVQLSPIESEGAKAVYSGNFFGNGKKPVMYTPDVPNGGNDALAHMLFAPAPHKVLPGGGIAADHLKEGGKMGVGPAAVFLTPPKEGKPKNGPLGMYEGAPITQQKTMGKSANLASMDFAQNALGPSFKRR